MTQPKNFCYGEEEQMLRETARKFLKNHCDELTLRDLVAGNPDPSRGPECLWDEETWKKIVELGWTTLAVPEDAEGAGMSAVSVATLVEEIGRAAFPSPLVATINATYVLASCDTDTAKNVLAEIAGGKTASLAITNRAGSWETTDTDVKVTDDEKPLLSGTAWFVQDAGKVDFFVVKAKSGAGKSTTREIGLYIVPADAPGVSIIPDSIVDLTRDQAHVEFKDVKIDGAPSEGKSPVTCIAAQAGKAEEALNEALPAILTVVSADMCGAAEWQLQTTAEFAKMRQQFGRPIAFFQAVKHPVVDMMIMIDNARSLVYNAACAIDCEPEKKEQYARMAKASACEMAEFCSGRSVQIHGGTGFTWECFVHLFFKRQKHNQMLYGDAMYQRAKLAEILISPV